MKQTLTLTNEWDKTFPKSEKVNHSKVTFHNRYGVTLAAELQRWLEYHFIPFVPEYADSALCKRNSFCCSVSTWRKSTLLLFQS